MTTTLHHGDALAVLKTLEDGSVDAVVTDPPYNVGFRYANHDDRRSDYREWCEAWLGECLRVSRGAVAISCGIVNLQMWVGIRSPKWVLCWWKPACTGRSPVGFNNWEPILVYGKPGGEKGCDVIRTTEQAALPVNHKKHPIAHPCPKPVEWAAKQIDLLCPPGGVVLDPFAGSGTTGVACVRKGCDFIGVEIDEAYFAVAERRIAETEQARDGVAGELFACLRKE